MEGRDFTLSMLFLLLFGLRTLFWGRFVVPIGVEVVRTTVIAWEGFGSPPLLQATLRRWE